MKEWHLEAKAECNYINYNIHSPRAEVKLACSSYSSHLVLSPIHDLHFCLLHCQMEIHASVKFRICIYQKLKVMCGDILEMNIWFVKKFLKLKLFKKVLIFNNSVNNSNIVSEFSKILASYLILKLHLACFLKLVVSL